MWESCWRLGRPRAHAPAVPVGRDGQAQELRWTKATQAGWQHMGRACRHSCSLLKYNAIIGRQDIRKLLPSVKSATQVASKEAFGKPKGTHSVLVGNFPQYSPNN